MSTAQWLIKLVTIKCVNTQLCIQHVLSSIFEQVILRLSPLHGRVLDMLLDAPVSRTRAGPSLKGCMVYGGKRREEHWLKCPLKGETRVFSRKTASRHCVRFMFLVPEELSSLVYVSMKRVKLNFHAPGLCFMVLQVSTLWGMVRDVGVCPVRGTKCWLSLCLNFSLCVWILNGVFIPLWPGTWISTSLHLSS